MTNVMQLARNSVGLARTVRQASGDHRRRFRKSESNLSDLERAEWMHEWCRKAVDRLGIRSSIVGRLPEPGLIVSNHLSYLDIFAFGSAMPCVFVSKAEVRQWPVFGKLTTMAGTVYIDRQRRTDTKNANEGIRRALEQGLRVVIFPEGTSSDGSAVLPFYPSLFEPAIERAVPITAACIRYQLEKGEVGRDIAYWGDMTFFPHLLKLLSKRGISVTVTFDEQSRIFRDRKAAASEMREHVTQLGYSPSSATAAEL